MPTRPSCLGQARIPGLGLHAVARQTGAEAAHGGGIQLQPAVAEADRQVDTQHHDTSAAECGGQVQRQYTSHGIAGLQVADRVEVVHGLGLGQRQRLAQPLPGTSMTGDEQAA